MFSALKRRLDLPQSTSRTFGQGFPLGPEPVQQLDESGKVVEVRITYPKRIQLTEDGGLEKVA